VADTVVACPGTAAGPLLEAPLAAIAARAASTDAYENDVRLGLAELGGAGVLDLGAPDNREGALVDMADVLLGVARGCMSTAFSAWAHRMAIEYLASHPTPWSEAGVLDELRAGARPGATALAPAFKDLLGLEPLGVTAAPDGDGLVLDGSVPWASNLFDEAVVVLAARTIAGGRVVVAVEVAQAGFTVVELPRLLALDSTRSGATRLEGVRVGPDRVLSEDLPAFLGRIRPTFLLLQTAFALGLASECVAQAQRKLRSLAAVFGPDVESAGQRLAALDADLHRYARAAGGPDQAPVRDLLQLRLDAAGLAQDAAALESKVSGGAGYVAAGATARRLREAAFLPVQSPTEGQLRWELARCAS
jgi:alkylation response protein AidB-like acyl-CoA dehydrogenase